MWDHEHSINTLWGIGEQLEFIQTLIGLNSEEKVWNDKNSIIEDLEELNVLDDGEKRKKVQVGNGYNAHVHSFSII